MNEIDQLFLDRLADANPQFTEDEIKHLYNIIESFLEVFGVDEYIIFHNEFMLPLLDRVKSKSVRKN